MNRPRTNLGVVLRRWRTMGELTIREAAALAGMNHTTWFRIEEGRAMDAATMVKLLKWMMEEAK